ITFWSIAPTDLIDVAESFGRDESGTRAFALEYGIDSNGGAMDEKACLRDLDLRGVQTILNPSSQIVRRRQRLASVDLPLIVDGDQVSECTSDINSDSHRRSNTFEILHFVQDVGR